LKEAIKNLESQDDFKSEAYITRLDCDVGKRLAKNIKGHR